MSLVSDEVIWKQWYTLSLTTRRLLIKRYGSEHAAAYATYTQAREFPV